jgi:hypothetical protein
MSSPHKPRRTQLSHLQRAAEVALLVAEVAAATDAIKRASNLGLIDIVWFDRCPLLARSAIHSPPVRPRARRIRRSVDIPIS